MVKILPLLAVLLSFNVLAEKSTPIFGQLDNGLHYALLPLHSETGHLEIRLRVNAGAVDEEDDQAGVAHMVEHLVFRGTEKYPNGLMPYLHENRWVRGRHYNAVTTSDNTTYMLTPPKDSNLEKTLDALSQMMFHAKITQADLDDERKIIREEWRGNQGVGSRMNRQRTDAVRAGSRYTRFPVIGTKESIDTMPATQLQHFYQRWYAPNNMRLLIVGDFQPKQAEAFIKQYFGSKTYRTLPKRDYLDPELSNQLVTKQLQDPQSGVSQIAYIFRIDDSRSRAQTESARYQRLLDQLALAAVTQRLRNEAENLPEGVRSVVVRRSDIGRNVVGLGFFSNVGENNHRDGLAQIFIELERLKRYPITQVELDRQKEKIQAQIDNAKKHDGNRDFSGWIQAMLDSFMLEKPYRSQPEIAKLTEPMLHKINLAEINQRINEWLATGDRVISYQAPKLTQIEPISVDFAEKLQQKIANNQISPPQQEKIIEPMSLSALEKKGSITQEQRFDKLNVVHWTLSNGDKVVWLKSVLAKDRTLFQAVNSAGFLAEELNAWQSQFAAQMIAQNAPLDWDIEQLNQWTKNEKVSLSIKQTADKLKFDGNAANEKLSGLLRLYYAYQMETRAKEGVDEARETMLQNLNKQTEKDEDKERVKAVSLLRYGRELKDSLPDRNGLTALSAQDLDQQWQKMVQAPTTYYFLNNLTEQEMKAAVERYLATIPRTKSLHSSHILPLSGNGEAHFAMNLEPRDDVKIWFFSPQPWQGKDAVMVSLLRQIVAQKLKLSLRDEHLGIYSLRFESELNPQTHRIESELSFVANPQLTEKLISQAKIVLADLPNLITEADIKTAKSQFAAAEKERLNSPHTWLNRLILSDEQYGDPRYLMNMRHLSEEITLENAKIMAQKLYNADNVKIFVVTPKK